MLTTEDCRLTAQMCAKLAQQAGDKLERSLLLQISDQFNRLANRKSKLGISDPRRKHNHQARHKDAC